MRRLQAVMICVATAAALGGLVPAASGAGDTQPPTTPTNLRVTETTPNSVSLAWDPSTDDSGSVFYRIIQDDFTYPVIDWVSGTSFVVYPLTPATTFRFRVSARDRSGNVSGLSNTVTATTGPEDTTPPSTPQNLRVTGTSGDSVSLAWERSTDNVRVMGYWIYFDGVVSRGTGDTQFTFTGVSPGTHRFSVTALDTHDPQPNESAHSNEVTVTTD
jgi:chitodextrinase